MGISLDSGKKDSGYALEFREAEGAAAVRVHSVEHLLRVGENAPCRKVGVSEQGCTPTVPCWAAAVA